MRRQGPLFLLWDLPFSANSTTRWLWFAPKSAPVHFRPHSVLHIRKAEHLRIPKFRLKVNFRHPMKRKIFGDTSGQTFYMTRDCVIFRRDFFGGELIKIWEVPPPPSLKGKVKGEIQHGSICKSCNFWIIKWISYFITLSHYKTLGNSTLISSEIFWSTCIVIDNF